MVRIYARSLVFARVHGHRRLDDDATGWQWHQRWIGQNAQTPFSRKCGQKFICRCLLSV